MNVRLIASTGKESLFFSYCMNKKVDPEVKTIHSIIHLWNVFQVTPQFYENFSAIFQFFIHLSGHRHLISIQNYKLSYTILWQWKLYRMRRPALFCYRDLLLIKICMPELQSNSNRQAGYFGIQGQAEFVWDSGEGQLAVFLFCCAFFYSSPFTGYVGIRGKHAYS